MAEFSWTSGGGFKASGLATPTKSVATTGKATFTCGQGYLPVQGPDGSWSCKPPFLMTLTRTPAVSPATAQTMFAMQALQQQKAAAAMQAPQSSQASMLGRYALYGVLAVGAVLIIYKIAKK